MRSGIFLFSSYLFAIDPVILEEGPDHDIGIPDHDIRVPESLSGSASVRRGIIFLYLITFLLSFISNLISPLI